MLSRKQESVRDGQTTAITISLTTIAGDNKNKTIAKCEINSQ